MKTITLLNEKGGVGKTTLAVHIAAGLACRGKRVLLIDGDPQGHATVRNGLKKAPGLYDLLVRDAEWKDVVRPIGGERFGIPGERLPDGKLWVLPSNVETRGIVDMISEADKLLERLQELESLVDVTVIDTSPTPSLLHGVFYTATDAIIYPTKLTYTSFDGLVESIRHRTAADKARSNRYGMAEIQVMGIIPTDYRQGTREQDENLASLRGEFGSLVWPAQKQRTIVTESESGALPVWNLDPNSDAALDMWEVMDRVEEGLHVRA